jgi:hypothetical protein
MTINRLKRAAKPFTMKKYLLLLFFSLSTLSSFGQILGGYIPPGETIPMINSWDFSDVNEIYYCVYAKHDNNQIFNGASITLSDNNVLTDVATICGTKKKTVSHNSRYT